MKHLSLPEVFQHLLLMIKPLTSVLKQRPPIICVYLTLVGVMTKIDRGIFFLSVTQA